MKRILLSLTVGILITLLIYGAGYIADVKGFGELKDVLLWQSTLLQSLIEMHNIGTHEKPYYEATPLHYLAFIISIPISVITYSILTYLVIKCVRKR